MRASQEEPWSTERLRDEIKRWRAHDYSTEEILAALWKDDPDLRPVASNEQLALIFDEVEKGLL